MPLKEANKPCPACSQNNFSFILDTKNKNGEFSLYECANCQGQFFFPFFHPGGNWYEQGDTYNQKDEAKPRHPHCYHQHFLKTVELPQKFTALDLGCGTGEFLNALKLRGGEAYGVDIDRAAIEIAKNFFPSIKFQAGKIEEFLGQPKLTEMDYVTMFEVFEHTDDPFEIIDAIQPWLKDSGKLFISLPSRERFRPNWAKWDFPLHHLSRWDQASLSKALSLHGFSVIRTDYINSYGQLREIILEYLADKLHFKQARRFKATAKTNNQTNGNVQKIGIPGKIKHITKKTVYRTARFIGVKFAPSFLASLIYPIAIISKPKSGVMFIEAVKIKKVNY
ncbi:MAG: class I SAM-dependent methyltransferase [Patescibacteria group bacterium]